MSFFAKQRYLLHPLERATLVALVVESLFLPWAWGSRDVWAQFTALGLALVALGLALWPRMHVAERRGDELHVLMPWYRLRRFPLFWLGLLLLGLITLQSLNPALRYEANTKAWWMMKQPHWSFLPMGVSAPFEKGNGWRMLVIYAVGWLNVCALWIGLSRRRALQILLGLIAANAVAVALVGIANRLSGSTEVLWTRSFAGAIGFGPFIYHNHGGAYVSLMVCVLLAMAAWFRIQESKTLARSSPAFVWLLGSIVVMVGVALSTSRAATVLLVFTSVASTGAWYWLKRKTIQPASGPRVLSLVMALAFLGWGWVMLSHMDFSSLLNRWRTLCNQGKEEYSYKTRLLVRESSLEMLADHWFYGTGAMSYRYLFVSYKNKIPELKKYPVWWDHAHIDWLQIPIEFGLFGCLIIGASMIWCVAKWIRWRGWRHPIGLFVFIGCMQTLAHAFVDFPFQNTAIIVTWWILVVIALRWLELDTILDEARQEAKQTLKN